MNNEEAKFILGAYRPGGQEARDPAFAEALAQARSDAALGRWWERSQAFDAAIARRLRETEVPAGLREAILAGGRMSSAAPAGRRPIWSHGWLAAAAILVITLGAAALVMRRGGGGESPAALAQFALQDVGAPGHIGDPDETSRSGLRVVATPLEAAALPVDFTRMEKDGCRSLALGGRKVLEVCFRRGGIDYHLYVMRREVDDRALAGPTLTQVASDRAAAAAWSAGAYVYALATKGSAAALQKLL